MLRLDMLHIVDLVEMSMSNYARSKWRRILEGLYFLTKERRLLLVYGFNMKCIREVGLMGPPHQLVKPKQILRNQFPIKAPDLYIGINKVLDFAVNIWYHTNTKKRSYVWYSLVFSRTIYQKQTIFFFDQSLSVKDGELY